MSTTLKQSGGDFALPPAGTHRARCYRIVDLGTQPVNWQGQTKYQPKVLIGWELADETTEDGRPFTTSARYTASLSDKATLRHTLESWRGRPFTAQELEGFQLSKVLNAPCLLTIAHEASKDGSKTYANVKAVTGLAKGMQPPGELVNAAVHYEIEQGRNAAFESFPEWLQKVISGCEEWNGGAGKQEAPHAPESPASAPLDDNIPF